MVRATVAFLYTILKCRGIYSVSGRVSFELLASTSHAVSADSLSSFSENGMGSYNTVRCHSMKFLQRRYHCLCIWRCLVRQRCFMMHRVYPSNGSIRK
jgi:hypothetical protein